MTLLSLLLLLALAAAVLATYKGASFILYDPTRKPHVVWPEQFGLSYAPVHFSNKDHQRLKGWWIKPDKPREPRGLILLCHGWGANKGDILEQTRFLVEKGGYDLFYFDFRACGESEGTMSTIGYLEAFDFDAAVEHLKRQAPELAASFGVWGLSMGGSVALSGAVRHAEIRAVVAESPFRSYDEVVSRWGAHKTFVPDFPLIPMARAWVRLRLGADPEALSPVRHVPDLGGKAVFYVVGDQDWLGPVSDSESLHAATPGPKDLWVVPGARHGDCWRAAPEEYERRVLAFFDRHLSLSNGRPKVA